MKKIDIITAFAISSIISSLYYGPFLDNYFVWDDFMMLENYYTKSFKEFLLGFADLRIFGNSILWINCTVSGFNPIGYSLISVIAHIVNSAMLFLLIYSLSHDRLTSIFAAVLFAASAVGSDAILWKDAFLTVTGLFLYMLILYLYVEGNKRGSRAFHNMALIVFVFAMFNKEEIASIPFMIIFVEMIFFRDGSNLTSKLKKAIPYFFVIIGYILLSVVVSRYLNLYQEQFERFLAFRPLHTMFSGYASFFISPDGRFSWKEPFIYITALLVPFALITTRNRKMFFFGLGWGFLTFLPQSLTSLTRYDVVYLFNSISRHLYLPSVGPAIVFSLVLLSIREVFSQKIFVAATALFFSVFIFTNYEKINSRGNEWRDTGKTMDWFLYSLKKIQPSLPENAHVRVLHGPGGRSYVMRALKAFYRNPKIYWIDEPEKDAYIYLYLNGYVVENHKSLMRLAYYVKNEDIRYVARFYELKGRHNEKLEMLRAISESSYNDAEKHVSLSIIYRDMTMWDDAVYELERACSIAPGNIGLHYDLGMAYLAIGRYDPAVKEFEIVTSADSGRKFPMAKGFTEYIKKQASKR